MATPYCPHHLRPVDDDAWPTAAAHLREGFAGKLNVYRVMANHPGLLRAWAPLREHVVHRSALPARLQELVVLRTAYRAGSTYEWAHHAHRGRVAGLTAEEIAAARTDLVPEGLGCLESSVLRAVDDLHSDFRLSPRCLASLAPHLSATQLLDLLAIVGFYHVLAYVVNTFDTPLDSGITE